MRKFFLLGAAVLMASSFVAVNAEAQLGLGYLHYDFPIGIFYDMDGSTLGAGVGFAKNDVPDGSGFLETELGIMGFWAMDSWSGDSWGFGPSVAAGFTTMSPEGDGDSSSMTMIELGLRGHWDATSNVSFWFSHGVDVMISSPPVGDSTTDFATSGWNIADLGFTVWLP
ncbi:hypothetical protein K8I85_04885 [bacterium]|nr:hypothetical protein [bacterium]